MDFFDWMLAGGASMPGYVLVPLILLAVAGVIYLVVKTWRAALLVVTYLAVRTWRVALLVVVTVGLLLFLPGCTPSCRELQADYEAIRMCAAFPRCELRPEHIREARRLTHEIQTHCRS